MTRHLHWVVGKTIAQGTLVGRPYNSALMKLPIRPKNRPGVPARASVSATVQNGTSAPPREQGAGGHHAEHGAVEGKPTMPDCEDVERMRGVLCRVVYQDVHEPRADEHPDDEIAHERVHRAFVERNQPTSNATSCNPDTDDVPDDVHHAVPSQRKWSYADDLRWDARVGDRHDVVATGTVGRSLTGPPVGALRPFMRSPRQTRDLSGELRRMHTKRLDHAGSTVSIACAIHCALSPLVLPLIPLTASRFVGPTLEWGFVTSSLILGVVSLGHSYRVIHRDWRAMALFVAGFTVLMIVRILEPRGVIEPIGVFGAAALIVAAHVMNLRLRRTRGANACACPVTSRCRGSPLTTCYPPVVASIPSSAGLSGRRDVI